MSSGMKKFLLLWIGELISSIGGGLTSFGLGVYVFQKTGNAAGMAFSLFRQECWLIVTIEEFL